jgi:hypothetical protein
MVEDRNLKRVRAVVEARGIPVRKEAILNLSHVRAAYPSPAYWVGPDSILDDVVGEIREDHLPNHRHNPLHYLAIQGMEDGNTRRGGVQCAGFVWRLLNALLFSPISVFLWVDLE